MQTKPLVGPCVRYQPADQVIDGLQTYAIIDMQTNTVTDRWYCQDHRDSALEFLNTQQPESLIDALIRLLVIMATVTALGGAIVYGAWELGEHLLGLYVDYL
jgi:hypothetical protein